MGLILILHAILFINSLEIYIQTEKNRPAVIRLNNDFHLPKKTRRENVRF
jgi:rRNA pseudouridine-1189 N-methylase Emg1 (Nep1/Mra1 family)